MKGYKAYHGSFDRYANLQERFQPVDKPKEKVYTLSPEDRDWLINFLSWNLDVSDQTWKRMQEVLDKLQKM
jgi:hypothetical protein